VNLACSGEPLLHPEFPRIIQLANKYLRNTDVSIVTNGYGLTPERQEILASSTLSRIFVSLDTLDPVAYARLCGTRRDSLHRVVANVEGLVEKCREKGGPKVILISIAMKSTLPRLPELARWVVDAGIDGMRVHWLEQQGIAAMQREIIGPSPQTQRIFAETRTLLAGNKRFFDYPYTQSIDKVRSVLAGIHLVRNRGEYLWYSLRRFLQSRKTGVCRMAGYVLTVWQSGNVQICPHEIVADCNLYRDPEDVIAKRIAQKVHQTRLEGNALCETCSLRQ
jgi:MoaA/NifB/PqqE/SkfB family radical SAM enzyme